MKTAIIHCFSGTGNTLLAARRLVAGLEAREVPSVLRPLVGSTPVAPGTSALGVAFPVACQSTYPFVWDFLAALPPGDGRAVFVMDTLHAHSGGLLAPLRRLLVEKGYEPIGAAEIRMPSNLRFGAPKEAKVAATMERAMAAVDRFALELVEGRAAWPSPGLLEPMVHAISRSRMLWGFTRWAMGLRHNPAHCSECGLCDRICPVGALDRERTPALDRKVCQICMRCYSYCPVGAVGSRLPWKPYRAMKLQELLDFENPRDGAEEEQP